MAEYCALCGSEIPDWYIGEFYQNDRYCLTCHERKHDADTHRYCHRCGAYQRIDGMKNFKDNLFCSSCYITEVREAKEKECAFCHREIKSWEEKFPVRDGLNACKQCRDSRGHGGGVRCARCGKEARWPFYAPDGGAYCTACAPYANPERIHVPDLSMAINRMFSSRDVKEEGKIEWD